MIRKIMPVLFVLLAGTTLKAQPVFKPDTANKINIRIMPPTQFILGSRDSSREITRLIGSVHLIQGDNDMTCDSAWFNIAANNVEAFGNVHIVQPGGTQLQSDYLRYIGDQKQAYLRGNVKLEDGKNSLYSEELAYNLGTKTAQYEKGGTLQSDMTTVSSNKGTYNVNTKDARFSDEVIVTDPDYNTTSDDLGYNTGTEVVTFFGPKPSTVVNDKSTLVTLGGTYDTKNEVARFNKRTSLTSKEQFVEGDKIDYNRHTGYGIATGHVIAIDTVQHITQWSEYASYNERSRVLISTVKPVLREMNGTDSLFLAADTFYSAPDMRGRQWGKVPKATTSKPGKKGRKKDKPAVDSTDKALMPQGGEQLVADSTAPRYYIAFHHVKIWSDSLQGLCDSLVHSEKDSLMRMMGSPVVWSRKSQLTGDTILMYLDSTRIRRMFIPVNALIVSVSGPEQAELYNQVQGRTLNAYFEKNTIREMVVKPDAQSIYYPKDDSDAYIGVNQSESERMRIFFKDEKIQTILFEQEVKQVMTPMEQADLPNMRLSKFKWLEYKRPKRKEDLYK